MAEIKSDIPKSALEYFRAEKHKHTEPYQKFYDEVIALLEKAPLTLNSIGKGIETKECNAKTYLEDFMGKFPNARLNGLMFPHICKKNVYGEGVVCPRDCVRCWNAPMEELSE